MTKGQQLIIDLTKTAEKLAAIGLQLAVDTQALAEYVAALEGNTSKSILRRLNHQVGGPPVQLELFKEDTRLTQFVADPED
jgi:hypothetical protein